MFADSCFKEIHETTVNSVIVLPAMVGFAESILIGKGFNFLTKTYN